jgi:hypothetical protein
MTAGGALAMAANKITGLANGTVATDAAAFGQISGFRVLQIQQSSISTAVSTTSSTFTAVTSLSVSITPASTSSTILIIACGELGSSSSATSAYATIKRGATNLGSTTGMAAVDITDATNVPCTMITWDQPASSSSLTYQVFIASSNNTNTVTWAADAVKSFIIAIEIG